MSNTPTAWSPFGNAVVPAASVATRAELSVLVIAHVFDGMLVFVREVQRFFAFTLNSGDAVNGLNILATSRGGTTRWVQMQTGQGFNNSMLPAIAPPPVSTFTWVNQGAATATDDSTTGIPTLFMTSPMAAANDRHLLVRSDIPTPTTPFTHTVGYFPGLDIVGNPTPISGILMRESGTAKFIEFNLYFTLNTVHLNNNRMTSPVAASAPYIDGQVQPVVNGLGPTWLRQASDGVNLTWSFSNNGYDFFAWDTRALTDFFTAGPNQVGLEVDDVGGAAGTKVKARFFHWSLTFP